MKLPAAISRSSSPLENHSRGKAISTPQGNKEISLGQLKRHSEERIVEKFRGHNPHMIKLISIQITAAIIELFLAKMANDAIWGFIKTSGIPQGSSNMPARTNPSRLLRNNTHIVGSDNMAKAIGKGERLYE